tara:strand:+ start:93 stop:290 length:198 start_codon:yes stop_codon:yes gene_type:complete
LSIPNSDPKGTHDVKFFTLGARHPDDTKVVSSSPENNNVLSGDDFMFGLELVGEWNGTVQRDVQW